MSLGHRLYTGEAGIDFVGKRKIWYGVTAGILLVSLLSFLINGFNFGIEFKGGNSFQIPQTSGLTLDRVKEAMTETDVEVTSSQEVGSALGGGGKTFLIRTAALSEKQSVAVAEKVAAQLKIQQKTISVSQVSPSWGGQITEKALIALAVFLVLLVIYLIFRYEWRMAIGAMLALFHDLLITAGVYSIVGFEVAPSTVIGFLTILGFSLYDTVVVFDKVSENARGILGGSRMTYSEAANLGINQTLMRSINTSIVALLPVAGLLFIGAGLLGAGTLKDLGLVLFVGMAAGAYSSIFLAVPIVAQIKEREPRYIALAKRVKARRAAAGGEGRRSARSTDAVADKGSSDKAGGTQPAEGKTSLTKDSAGDDSTDGAAEAVTAGAGGSPARRPAGGGQQRKRPGGGKGGRPSGKRRN